MFGGVSKSYVDWAIVEQPYRKNGNWYCRVKHPKYNMTKEVRFYTDTAHAELMPKKEFKKFHQLFGFDTLDSKIKCIKECDLSEEELQKYFWKNWEKGDGIYYWRMGCFFEDKNNRGVWYAPLKAPDYPIANADCVFQCDWQTFKKEGQKHSNKIKSQSDYWFRPDEE